MEFLRSFLRRHFSWKPVVASGNVGCFLRLVFPPPPPLLHNNYMKMGCCDFFRRVDEGGCLMSESLWVTIIRGIWCLVSGGHPGHSTISPANVALESSPNKNPREYIFLIARDWYDYSTNNRQNKIQHSLQIFSNCHKRETTMRRINSTGIIPRMIT